MHANGWPQSTDGDLRCWACILISNLWGTFKSNLKNFKVEICHLSSVALTICYLTCYNFHFLKLHWPIFQEDNPKAISGEDHTFLPVLGWQWKLNHAFWWFIGRASMGPKFPFVNFFFAVLTSIIVICNLLQKLFFFTALHVFLNLLLLNIIAV